MLIFSKRVLGLGGQAGTRHHALLTSFLLCFGGGVLLATTMVKIFQKLENISQQFSRSTSCQRSATTWRARGSGWGWSSCRSWWSAPASSSSTWWRSWPSWCWARRRRPWGGEVVRPGSVATATWRDTNSRATEPLRTRRSCSMPTKLTQTLSQLGSPRPWESFLRVKI